MINPLDSKIKRRHVMDVTPEIKKVIDDKSYRSLLYGWRFAGSSDEIMQGESGEYWGKRMAEIKPANHVQISKDLGWVA